MSNGDERNEDCRPIQGDYIFGDRKKYFELKLDGMYYTFLKKKFQGIVFLLSKLSACNATSSTEKKRPAVQQQGLYDLQR